MTLTPELRPIADTGVLVEFADHIDDGIHQRVLNLDAAVQSATIAGITELIPAYSSLFVGYDALQTDYATISRSIYALLNTGSNQPIDANHWRIPVCYEHDYAPDMPEVCETLNLSAEEVIAHHTAGLYKVYTRPGDGYTNRQRYDRRTAVTYYNGSHAIWLVGDWPHSAHAIASRQRSSVPV